MTSITILLTSYNRKEKTKQCIESIYSDNYTINYIVTNDGSTDGTKQMLQQLMKKFEITVLNGNGELYWCGGMRKAISYALERKDVTDYYVLVNDDVTFEKDALEQAIGKSQEKDNAVVVGAICNQLREQVYGGVRYRKNAIKYDMVYKEDLKSCDTFNCNFVLLPYRIFMEAGNFDIHYRHSLADFDYGLHITKMGYRIYSTEKFLGVCERNSRKNTWMDCSLTRKERIKKKESPKGLPYKEWFYFVRKNFGMRKALWHSVTPYIKIMVGK